MIKKYQKGGPKLTFPEVNRMFIPYTQPSDNTNVVFNGPNNQRFSSEQFQNVPLKQQKIESIKKVSASEKLQKENKLKKQKEARTSIDNPNSKFIFPDGSQKTQDQMNWREKAYTAGLSLGVRSKIDENNTKSFIDEYLNPFPSIFEGLGTAPYVAKQTNSNMPYVAGIGMPLALGAFAGIGSKTTGQFVNNLVNPLAGIKNPFKNTGEVIDNLGNRYLPNAYKYNPFAFKPQEGMMYRGLGKEGMEDALQSGVFRPASRDSKKAATFLDNNNNQISLKKSFDKTYYSPDFNIADTYGKGYIAEVPNTSANFLKRYGDKNWSWLTDKQIPIQEGKILQKDWLRRYKEVSKQLPGLKRTDYMSLLAPKGNMYGQNQVLVQQSRLLNPKIKDKFFKNQAPEFTSSESTNSIFNLEKTPKDFNNRITPENYEDFVNRIHGSTAYDFAASANKKPGNLGVGNYNMPGKVFKDAPLNELGKDIINAHEKNHGIFAGTLSKEMQESLLKPFGTKQAVPHYAFKHQADEVLARMGQFKNAVGIGDNQVFTLGHLNLIRKNYANSFLDNGITEMLAKIKPGSAGEKEFLKNMNKYALGTLPIVIGAGALQQKQLGGKINDNNGYLISNMNNFTPKKIIKSNHITTQGMAFPIKANGVPLYPNTGDYIFPTNRVVELPMFQEGGPILNNRSMLFNQMPNPTFLPLDRSRKYYLDNKRKRVSETKIGIGDERGEWVIPTTINGVQLSEQDAVDHFYQTGEHMGGPYETIDESNKSAESRTRAYNGLSALEDYKNGGIPDRYKKQGFTKVGQEKDSTRPGKKWMVLAKKGDSYKVVHGGDSSMQDYTQHHDNQRKKNFWNRMGHTSDKFSPRYWHQRLGKWEEGGTVNTYKQGGINIMHNGQPMYRTLDGRIVKRGLWSNTYLSNKK
jgi:hypothetical protein